MESGRSRKPDHGVVEPTRLRRSWVLWRSAVALIAVAAVALEVSACGGSSSHSASAGAGAVSTGSAANACGSGESDLGSITVGIPVDDPSYAPIYLAQERDLWCKRGLDVKVVAFQGGADLEKAVVGGSVDIAVSALSEMLLGVQQGVPLKAFYGGYNTAPFYWMAQPGIDSVEDGRGKRWGVTRVGSLTDFLTRYLLEKNNMDPTKDVNIVAVGGGGSQVAAMKAKQVDIVITSPPTNTELEQAGTHEIASMGDLTADFPVHVAYAREEFLADHRDQVIAFLQGQAEGMELAKNDPDAAIAAIAERTKVSEELAKVGYDAYRDYWDPDGRLPSQEGMDVFWKVGEIGGWWSGPIPESKWLDRQFMDTYSEWSDSQA